MAKYFLYLKSDLDDQLKTYASRYGISAKDALKIIVDRSLIDDKTETLCTQIASLERKNDLVLTLLERLVPEVSYLATSTRSSLSGKGTNPGIDGEIEAEKSKRFLSSLLKDISPAKH